MSTFQAFPLGSPVPNSPHAVVVSLPTMDDVIGYEERRPATMAAARTGYPRFLRHPFVIEAGRRLAADNAIPAGRTLFPVASAEVARRSAALAGIAEADIGVVEADDWALLHLSPENTDATGRAGKIIQHIGVTLSSRQAEDWLVAHGALPHAATEQLLDAPPKAATEAVRRALAPWFAPVPAEDVLLCRSGMNAFYAAFEAVRTVQRPRGRNIWLQLGWLYTDTTETLRKCTGTDEKFFTLYDVLDKKAIEHFFAEHGSRIAGIVTEGPTNPLIRTPDFAHLQALARKHGVLCIFDPSTSGFANVNLLPWSDVLVTSLTKYAAHEGDVMLGALAVNPQSPFHADLLAVARREYSPAYWRDAARLAVELGTMPGVVERINANTLRLAAWLEKHPGAQRIRWAEESASAANYARIARGPGKPGSMITLETTGDPTRFYDRIRVVKGPSFGTSFTIVSPFIYMAHYDLVTEPASRRDLQALGINPELMRVSVGAEPFAEMAEVFGEALR
jgi:cystathionine gamma-synthase